MAVSTGKLAGMVSTHPIEWMRYLLMVFIGIAGALFWQVDTIREEAERRVVRALSHHLNNSLNVVLNRNHLDPMTRDQIVDEQVQRCVWAVQTILPALNVSLPELLHLKQHKFPSEWVEWMQPPTDKVQ
jgi:hypothetical protein